LAPPPENKFSISLNTVNFFEKKIVDILKNVDIVMGRYG